MTHVVHLRIKAAGGDSAVAYDVEATLIQESGAVSELPVITVPLESGDPGDTLWRDLAGLFPPDSTAASDDGIVAPTLAILRLHAPELHDVDWEGLARDTSDRGLTRPVTVLRSEVGAGNFQPGEQLPFHDLPLRVLVVGVDSSVERGTEPTWHEDVAVHAALSPHADRWEVDVLPGPVTHDSLSATLKEIQPHVLHLAGDAAHDLLVEGSQAHDALNFSSVRLVVSSSGATPQEARRLLRPHTEADALHPVSAAISLTPLPGHTREMCPSVQALYGALAEGRSLVEAAARAVEGEEGRLAATSVTANRLPDQVLPRCPTPAAEPSGTDLGTDPDDDHYEPLIGATDRVAQRRTALDFLESGNELKKLIVLSGNGAEDPIGTTCLMLSLKRVWEKRPRSRALYLNFKELRSDLPPRPAGAPPPPPPSVLVQTVALLIQSVRRDSRRTGGWNVDDDLEVLAGKVDAMRQGQISGERRVDLAAMREDLLESAKDLVVNVAPPGIHLVLALDHFAETGAEGPGLVTDLFNVVLHRGRAVSVVATARKPDAEARAWLERFNATRHPIELHPWPPLRAGSLLRELGEQLGYDWHNKEEWRDMVRTNLVKITGEFGPTFLNDVHWAAVTKFG